MSTIDAEVIQVLYAANEQEQENKINIAFAKAKPLLDAIRKGDLESVKKFFNTPEIFEIDQYFKGKLNVHALHVAAMEGNLPIMEYLLKEQNIDPNGFDFGEYQGDNTQETVLHTVTSWVIHTYTHCEATIRLLMQYKANVNTVDHKGSTPLMNAARAGVPAMVKTLLEYNADPNIIDPNGFRALGVACNYAVEKKYYKDHLTVVELLLKAGANINQRCHNHDQRPLSISGYSLLDDEFYAETHFLNFGTPLIVSAIHFAKDIFDRLLELKADVNLTCIQGMSPLFYLTQFPIQAHTYSSLSEIQRLQMTVNMGKKLISSGAIYDCLLNPNPLTPQRFKEPHFQAPRTKELSEILHVCKKLSQIANEISDSDQTSLDLELASLENQGASFFQRTVKRFNTPLHEACYIGNHAKVRGFLNYFNRPTDFKILIQLLSSKNAFEYSPLDEAVKANKNKKTIHVIMNILQSAFNLSWMYILLSASFTKKDNILKKINIYEKLLSLDTSTCINVLEFIGFFGKDCGYPESLPKLGGFYIREGLKKAQNSVNLRKIAIHKIETGYKTLEAPGSETVCNIAESAVQEKIQPIIFSSTSTKSAAVKESTLHAIIEAPKKSSAAFCKKGTSQDKKD